MAAALVAGDGMNLVHDDHAGGAQKLAAALRGQEDVQRLGGGDQDVGRAADHEVPLARGRVARAHHGPDLRQWGAGLLRQCGNCGQRFLQVLLDVVAQGFEGGHIDDRGLVTQRTVVSRRHQVIDRPEKCGQRLAGPGRGRDQRVSTLGDVRPALDLRCGRLPEPPHKPTGNQRME